MLSHATITQPAKGKAAHAMSRLAMLWLAFALLCQGFVVQTHAHFAGDRDTALIASVQTAASTVSDTATAVRKRGPATPACPLCEEQALFGAYLLGGTITLAPPAAVAGHATAATFQLLALNPISHAWRSRAPPIAHA